MICLHSFFLMSLTLGAISAQGRPFAKRIDQTISDSTTQWETACTNAGGGSQCNTIAVNAFSTLLAGAGNCDQQNAADSMIDLANTLDNNAEMITLTQIFVQQPRNSPNSVSVPYCTNPPANSELDGLYQCQFQGVDLTTFVGGLTVGENTTIPFGLSAPVSPPGSCPANPSGPIPAGEQLVDITQNPGVAVTNGGSTNITSNATSSAATATTTTMTISMFASAAPTTTMVANASSTAATPSTSTSSSTSFQLSNGQAAQQLNAEFATLTATSSCTSGENACVNGEFAQCVSGAFVLTSCGSTLSCYALPLVNSAGTSITCTTESDAETRIAATGATGGITGSNSTSASTSAAVAESTTADGDEDEDEDDSDDSCSSTPSATVTSAAVTATATSSFALSNGQEAQQLNSEFASLTAESSCTDGQNACVDGSFAQCVSGSYVLTSCGSGLSCYALPLVNSAGTSITCATESDAETRIAATGATGGITGLS